MLITPDNALSLGSTGTFSSLNGTYPQQVDVGDTVIILLAYTGGGDASYVDAHGNTYTQIVKASTGTATNATASIVAAYITTEAQFGDALNLTLSVATTGGITRNMLVVKGLANNLANVKFGSTVVASGTPNSVSCTPTTDNDFAISIGASDGTTIPTLNTSVTGSVAVLQTGALAGGSVASRCDHNLDTLAAGSKSCSWGNPGGAGQVCLIASFPIDKNDVWFPLPNQSPWVGNSKTSGTTLSLTGITGDVLVGDDLLVWVAADTGGGLMTISRSGTATLGSQATVMATAAGTSTDVRLYRIPITGAGTITDLTITLGTAVVAKAAEATVVRNLGSVLGTGASSTSNGDLQICRTVSGPPSGPAAGSFVFAVGGWEGIAGDMTGTVNDAATASAAPNIWGHPQLVCGIQASSGQGAASNQGVSAWAIPKHPFNSTSASVGIITSVTLGANRVAIGSWAAFSVNTPSGPANIAGTAAGVGASSGALKATPLLSGSAAGVGTATGQPATTSQLTGSAAGTSTASGALNFPAQLSGSSAGIGTSTGTLKTTPALAGASAGVGTTTGALKATPLLSGSSSGVGTATGNLTAASLLSGSAAGIGSTSGVLTATPKLTGSAAGVGAATGIVTILDQSAQISGTAAGVGTASGVLTATPLLNGSAAGVGTTTGALKATPQLSGSSAGVGASAGALTASPKLSGTSSGVGNSTGALTATALLTGSAAGVGTLVGQPTVPGTAFLTGTAAGAGLASGVLAAAPKLSGTLAGIGATSGALTASPKLSGTLAGIGNTTGALKTTPQLSGTSAGVGNATGQITTAIQLVGSADGVGFASGFISIPSPIIGTASGIGNVTGNLQAASAAKPLRPLNTYGHIEVAASGFVRREGQAGIIHEATTGIVK